jgi:putative ABC transport system substrate-binding protein
MARRGFPAFDPIHAADRVSRRELVALSYAVDLPDLWRRAASYVDRVLKGHRAADLPVQAPIKFGLVIDLKAAKAQGLDVPLLLLARADEVLE